MHWTSRVPVGMIQNSCPRRPADYTYSIRPKQRRSSGDRPHAVSPFEEVDGTVIVGVYDCSPYDATKKLRQDINGYFPPGKASKGGETNCDLRLRRSIDFRFRMR